ncbi:MAG: serine hydrolase, partial [Microbacterium sp.]
MGSSSAPVPEPVEGSSAPVRRSRRGARRLPRRAAVGRRSFTSTLRALEDLADAGAQVSVHVADLDSGAPVLAGDDHVTLPIAGLGIVPLLVEVAAGMEAGTLDPFEIVDRDEAALVSSSGLWRHMRASALPLIDLAVFAATVGDPNAVNALLHRVGHERVRGRLESLGMPQT